jgi:hypothetical protein
VRLPTRFVNGNFKSKISKRTIAFSPSAALPLLHSTSRMNPNASHAPCSTALIAPTACFFSPSAKTRRARLAASVGLTDAVTTKRQLKEKEDELEHVSLRLVREEKRAAQLAEDNQTLRDELAAAHGAVQNLSYTSSSAGNAELAQLRKEIAVRDSRIQDLEQKLEIAERERRNAEAGMQRALRDAAVAAEKAQPALVDDKLVATNQKLRAQLVTERFKELGCVCAPPVNPMLVVSCTLGVTLCHLASN